jgi:ketosteroid isomerase-like protein
MVSCRAIFRYMKYVFFFALLMGLLTSSCATKKTLTNQDRETITALMHASAQDWNSGKLDQFMSLYDTAATFMMTKGPVGLEGMRENYQKGFFNGDQPKQQLRFEDLVVRPLGGDHALLTGKFVLSGNNLPEKRGIYSLVFVKRASGWKILHDHSS